VQLPEDLSDRSIVERQGRPAAAAAVALPRPVTGPLQTVESSVVDPVLTPIGGGLANQGRSCPRRASGALWRSSRASARRYATQEPGRVRRPRGSPWACSCAHNRTAASPIRRTVAARASAGRFGPRIRELILRSASAAARADRGQRVLLVLGAGEQHRPLVAGLRRVWGCPSGGCQRPPSELRDRLAELHGAGPAARTPSGRPACGRGDHRARRARHALLIGT
jgi:hypothetical protein